MRNWGAELRGTSTLYGGAKRARSHDTIAAMLSARSMPGRHWLRGEPSRAEPVISASLWPL